MIWQEFSPIHSQVQDALANGFELHTLRTAYANTITVRIVNSLLEVVHFTKEYSASLENSQLLTAMLTDIHKFNEYWNSPLMKALR